jgi:hypothetical protein
VWPIFDCYSNMPLFVYRIRDLILECTIIDNSNTLTYNRAIIDYSNTLTYNRAIIDYSNTLTYNLLLNVQFLFLFLFFSLNDNTGG